uniref:Uncharacterized protein n=1 Tax=Avena sativa TaxID=4498 RepID=A0ACD5YHJ5_AVESA
MGEQPPADNDWSNLPADVLATVFCQLEFPDLFRSAAVCTTWRSTLRALHRLGVYNCPQTPCLIYTTAAAGPRAAELFSLAEKNIYKRRIPDPPIGERNIVGSSHGWLVTADARSELHLLNPATGEQLALPPVATIEQVNPVLKHDGGIERYELSFYDATHPRKEYEEPTPYRVDELRHALYLKVVLSCDPSRGDCIAMMIHNPYRQLLFARVGDKKWHWVTTYQEYSDCIFQDGAFYAMNLLGGIHRYTIGGSCATHDVIFKDTSPFIAHNVYISGTPSGDVLQIWRMTVYTYREPQELHTTRIEVYKADFDKQKIVAVHSLGDDALFIGHNHTFCISTKDYPQLLPNHVYFTDDDEYWLFDGRDGRRDVGIYSLEDKCVKDVVSPQKWLNWPVPYGSLHVLLRS